MATNYKNTQYYYQTTLDSVPSSIAGSGTIVTAGTLVTGTGTSFLTEMPVGSWLVSASAGEVRRVISVTSNTSALIDYGFTINLGAAAPRIITPIRADVKEISITNAGGVATTIDGETFPANSYVTVSKAHRHDSSYQDTVNPIVIDGATSECMVLIIKN